MAKITITSLAIENLGPFRERQVIGLQVRHGKPVVLVKALNGSGKTTLLTALQIGLYGQKAVNPTRRSEYEQLLLGLQRTDATSNSVVEIDVIAERGDERRKLTVRREWCRGAAGLNESLTVFLDGEVDIDFTQGWEEFIDGILPAELVQLFLFDGEKIEALANPDRLPDLLRHATEVFLGIGGIDALGNDLKAVERRAALKHRGDSEEFERARTSVDDLSAQVAALDEKHAILLQELAGARNEHERAQVGFDRYSADAQRQGLTAYEQAARIRDSMVLARKASEEVKASLADAMADSFVPLVWVSVLWGQYEEMWKQDQQARLAKRLSREFKRRDLRILETLAATAPKEAVEIVRQALSDDLKRYRSEQVSKVVMQDADPEEAERRRDEAVALVKKELARLNIARAKLDRAEQQVGQIPAEEQMGEILRRMQDRAKVVASAEARLVDLTRQLEETASHANHLRVRLNAAQGRMSTEFRDRSLEGKALEASARARQALTLFKVKLLASKAQWLSSMITAEFKSLLRKRNLVSSVVVDPESYRVSIKDGRSQELPMERLSAGERQLLAISVLSALIKERRGHFPVVVDTPLARLDLQHRSTLVKRFFAAVSHQVVVLSTDQEVEGSAYEALRPYTNAEYSLEFDDAMGRTTILPRAAVAANSRAA